MSKLIVQMNPVSPAEIFEIKQNAQTDKIFQADKPLDVIQFLANYMSNNTESTEIVFVGPDDYVDPWVVEANQFEFVKATKKI